MKKIILASASRQRKKLLKLLGIQFIVQPSSVCEIQKIKTNCASLVKANALNKAQDIASKVKEGVVIGSDTVVYIGGKKNSRKTAQFKRGKKATKDTYFKSSMDLYGCCCD